MTASPNKIVPETEHGRKLDAVLARLFPHLSRKLARQAIMTGRVRLNGKTTKIFARAVKTGDVLIIEDLAALQVERESPPPTSIRLLYEDRDCLVIAKPADLLSENVPGEKTRAVIDAIHELGLGASFLVHRLDAGTSGVMVLARNEASALALSEAFRLGQVQKSYILLCVGNPGQGVFSGALARDPSHPRRFAVRAGGKSSETRYRTLATSQVGDGEASLVSARPKTGRTHQIRVHFAHAGYALLGDGLYRGPRHWGRLVLARPHLHALALSFPHPQGHGRKTFVCPPPEDFAGSCAALKLRLSFDGWDPLW